MNNPATCRKCEMPLDIGAEFCGNCGTAVDPRHHPAPARPKTAVALEPDGNPNFDRYASASLVIGLMAVVSFWYFPVGIPTSVAALTLGLLGRGSAKKTRAVWGMALGIIALICAILFFAYYLQGHLKVIEGDPGGF